MIKSNMGKVQIVGPAHIVMAEFESAIRGVYEALAKEVGEEQAKEYIVLAGQRAFDEERYDELAEEHEKNVSDAADDITRNIIEMVVELMEGDEDGKKIS